MVVKLELGLGSCLPDSWISTTMKYRQDDNAMILRTKKNAVRKTVGYNAPNIFVSNSKLVRMLRCK